MSGLFEHIEMFDESDKVATRQAIAVANKRFNDKFAGFLRQASTKKEFESRLALVDTDINNMVVDVANEYGGDAEKIASAIKDAAAMTHIATCDCDGKCEGMCKCGGCDSCKCSNQKEAKDKRPEHLKAQDEIQLADEHSQVPPWLKKQIADEDQEDGGNLRNKEANEINSQPFSQAVPHAVQPGHPEESIDQTLENAPSAVGNKEAGLWDRAKGALGIGQQAPQTPSAPSAFEEDEDSWDAEIRKDRERKERAERAEYVQTQADALAAGREKQLGLERQQQQQQQIAQQEQAERDRREKAQEDYRRWTEEEATRPWSGDAPVPGFRPEPSIFPRGASAGAHKVEEKGDKFYVTEKGEGEVAGPFDSSEDAHARANELNDLENLEKEAGLWSDFVRDQRKPQAAPAEGATPTDEDGEIDDLDLLTPPKSPDNPDDYILGPVGMAAAHGLENAGNWAGRKLFGPKWPNRGASVTPAMAKALQLKEAAKPETGDKTEERESLPKGNEDALGGPSPKIDKKKWVPNATNPDGNLEPIDTEGENSPHPTRHMDIKQKPDYQQDTLENLDKYDNNVWSREQLPSADDNAGFNTERNISQDGQSGTFSDKGQAKPVTREALAAMDRTASFRVFLNDIGMSQADFRNATDEQKSKLWDIYNNYDMPKYTEEQGLDQPLREEPIEEEIAAEPNAGLEPELEPEVEDLSVDEDLAEEPIIDEGPEEIEEIIEREDDDDDRVEVIDEDEGDFDLDQDPFVDDEDPFADAENISDEELQNLIDEFEDNPDEY